MPRFLPLGLDVREKPCLVVGGGSVGTRKALALARAGAEVTVLAPAVTDELAGQIEDGRITWLERTYGPEHARGVFLVVAATDDDALNATIGRDAHARGILVCDASSAARSAVIFAALHETDEVTVAVFTDGRDPRMARDARDRIAAFLDEED
jgi:uroporphyrin-III C-methyltransferase/precorrin-2 dehydrogenase/sirohydrochlorin ferrochelatase